MLVKREFLVVVTLDDRHPHAPTREEFARAIEDELTGPAPEKFGIKKITAKFTKDLEVK